MDRGPSQANQPPTFVYQTDARAVVLGASSHRWTGVLARLASPLLLPGTSRPPPLFINLTDVRAVVVGASSSGWTGVLARLTSPPLLERVRLARFLVRAASILLLSSSYSMNLKYIL